jgi:hypothetical protein
MSEYEIWRYLHILMFVFWLGTDMGVMISAKRAVDAQLSVDARLTLLKSALLIELLPRTMWVAALPLGVQLSQHLGLVTISTPALVLVWLFAAFWWVVNFGGAYYIEQPLGLKLARINRWVTGLLGLTLIAVAVTSYLSQTLFATAWLAAKVGLYGVIQLTILGIELTFVPVGAAFGRLVTEGSTPEVEAQVSATMNRSLVFVYVTYVLIAIVALIGVTKPFG